MKLACMIPDTPARLRELLLMIFDGRPYLQFAGVNVATASLDIVWRPEAAQDGYHSVYVPLKRARLADAQRLVEYLLSQMSLSLPPSEASAEDLFDMLDRRPAEAVADRPDYDGITPADALTTDADEAPQPSERRDVNELT